MRATTMRFGLRYLPELAGGLWLIIYAGLKFQAVALGLKAYQVNPYIFFLLDTITVPGYVWGSGQIIRRLHGQGLGRHLAAPILTALVSQIAPYAYLFISGGRQFPPAVSLVILTILGLSLYLSWRKLFRAS